jgi:Zn-dependent protease with chaperone function
MKQTISLLHTYARLATWTFFLICVLQVNALDVSSSCTPAGNGPSSDSLSSTDQAAPGSERKPENPGKYDIDRIGQRNIGKGINLYSLEKERELGEAMAAVIDRQVRFATDPAVKDYVNRLGQKIVRSSDAQVPFSIKVIDSKNPTTFSLPGGFLYIDIALIMDVDDEAELAGLMAHEIAHVTARHATRLATRKDALDLLQSLPVAAIIGPSTVAAGQIGIVPVERKFNREFEYEADLLGVEYQYAAGYDPQAYIDALEKLDSDELQKHARESRNNPKPDWVDRMYIHIGRSFALYPPMEARILRLQSEISKLLPQRNNYVLDTGEFQEVKAQLGAERLVLRRPRHGDSASGPTLERRPPSDDGQEPTGTEAPRLLLLRPHQNRQQLD